MYLYVMLVAVQKSLRLLAEGRLGSSLSYKMGEFFSEQILFL